MILTGSAILKAVEEGRVHIDPFDPARVNPNSYNYRLSGHLRTSVGANLDAAQESEWEDLFIPPSGLVLEPGRLYLGCTIERIGSNEFVPSLIGRSSVGRLGLYLQVSADLGNLGAIHRWTLELVTCQPLRIYEGMSIGQVSFWHPSGDIVPYLGLLGNASTPTASLPSLLGLGFNDSATIAAGGGS